MHLTMWRKKMPCLKKSNGKWGIGSGKGIYSSKSICEKAYRGYLASKHMKHHSAPNGSFLDKLKKRFRTG